MIGPDPTGRAADGGLPRQTVPVSVAAEPIALRPWLRGTLHRWSVPVTVAATALVAAAARSGGARAAVIVYGICLTAMFATSGVYHARRWAHRPRSLLQRLDHSMILIGIAGSYTPVIILALDGAARIALAIVCWTVAVVGIVIRQCWLEAPRPLIAAVYLAAGWQMIVALPAYAAGLTGLELALLAVGGVLYTVGAVVFAARWPNPWPRVAGFHEVFHFLVVLAAGVHLVAIASLAT